MKRRGVPDPTILLLTLVLTVIGLAAIWDAGYARTAHSGFLPPEVLSQGKLLGFAIGGILAGWLIPAPFWKRFAPWALGVSIVLLLLVSHSPLGHSIGGAQRWIKLGSFTIQPAEFAKLACILFLAAAMSGWKSSPKPARPFKNWGQHLDHQLAHAMPKLWPLMLVALTSALIVLEPDLATGCVILATTLGMLIVAGVSWKKFGVVLGALAVVCTVLAISEPYRVARLTHHGERWAADNIDSIGFQTTISETAMARGGLLGVGIGEGQAKHALPAPTTDFILATVAEETGLLGSLVLMTLLGWLCYRLLALAIQCKDRFGKLVISGVATWLAVQSSVNVMMANGFLPPIGIPLPLISAGGSSLLAIWTAVGICMSLAAQTEEVHVPESRRHGWRNGRARLSRA